jgi:mannose-6-phosphate isomerase-like protein (cupin superfamily)
VSARRRAGFDPLTTLVHLRENGRARPIRWTPGVFRKLAMGDRDHVIGAEHATRLADFHADEWEMHPRGDEGLYLLRGAVDVVLDEPAGERAFALRGGQACLVPRGGADG